MLGPLLFLLYINDLNKAVVHSKVHHFADDTKFLYANRSLKNLKKTVNFDLSNLVQWLRANKISLNANKTEIIVFRSRTKQIYKSLSFRLSRQKIKPKRCTKYLEVIIDEHMSFNEYMNTLKQKLNRANGILAKLRYYVTADVLKTIYFAFFNSHVKYACHIWRQVQSKTFDTIQRTQNKALSIISFKHFMEPSEPLYNQVKINILKNNIIRNNCLFVFDNLTNNLPDVFDQFFKPFKELHNHNTRGSQQYLLNIPKTNTQMSGSNSIKIKSMNDWNKMIHKIHFSSELLFKRNEFIKLVKNTFVA